jgi:polysaccharide pyruvyl transferase WcaK-like protein
MKSQLKKLKKFAINYFDVFAWGLAFIYAHLTKQHNTGNGALILPAGDLDGGFGEDIMVAALVSQINTNPITIFTGNVIHRPDYLSDTGDVKYIGGFKENSYFKYISIIKRHQSAYIIGADILDAAYGKFNALSRLRFFRLAEILGKNPKILAFSISEKTPNFIKKEFSIISKTNTLTLRDPESASRMKKHIGNRVNLGSDIAFLCPTNFNENNEFKSFCEWADLQKATDRKIAAVCPNAIQASKSGKTEYIRDFKNLLSSFSQLDKLSFIFLYHDLRPQCERQSDKDLSRELYSLIADGEATFFPESITNGVTLKSYLTKCDFSITGRMHLGISGMTLGLPMFGLGYQNKFEGLQSLFEIPASESLIDYTSMNSGTETIKIFSQRQQFHRELILKNRPNVIQLAKHYLTNQS